MSYLGLTPSEYSSGSTRRLGGITQTGNAHARRTLIEGAWAYRYNAKVSRHIQQRQEALPQAIRDIAWKAQVRLCKRYRRLLWPKARTRTSWSWRSQASSRRFGPLPGTCLLRPIMPRQGEEKRHARGRTPCGPGVNDRKRSMWTSRGQGPSCPPLAHPHSPRVHTALGRQRCVPDRSLQQSFDKTNQDPCRVSHVSLMKTPRGQERCFRFRMTLDSLVPTTATVCPFADIRELNSSRTRGRGVMSCTSERRLWGHFDLVPDRPLLAGSCP